MMKRFILIFAALALLLCLFAGCASGNQEGNASLGVSVGQGAGASGNSGEEKDPSVPESMGDPEGEGSSGNQQGPADSEGSKEPAGDPDTPVESPSGEDDKAPSNSQDKGDSNKEPEKNPAETVDYTSKGWIKVCSYNVKVLYYDHVNNANGQPMSKFDAVCAELRKIDADIVGLQELDRFSTRCGAEVDQLKMLADTLGYPYYYYTFTVPSYGGPNAEYGHGIMSRYPILKKESYFFADFPGNIDASEPRGFSRSELKISDKKTLVFYNAHLAEKSSMQMLNISMMMEQDMQKGKYAVLTGDMNAWPWELAQGIDSDFCTMLNTVEGEQHTGYQKSQDGSIASIDNIVVTNNLEHYWDSVKKTGIVVTYTPASDHLPIYTYIKMK